MIDIQKLRENPEAVAQNLARRGVPGEAVQKLVELDKTWRNLTTEFDQTKAEQNTAGKKVKAAPSKQEIATHVALPKHFLWENRLFLLADAENEMGHKLKSA